MKCVVELCANEAVREKVCEQHLRKLIKGQIETDMYTGAVYDLCSRGHRWSADNIHWEGIPGKATKRRRCRKCLSLKASRRRKTRNGFAVAPSPVRPNDAELSKAIDDLETALSSSATAKCKQNPGPYTDYEEDSPPTNAEAKELCSGCPLLMACANSAHGSKPGYGVWGGEIWYMGRPIKTEADRAWMRSTREETQ